jgi:hypothetical protein
MSIGTGTGAAIGASVGATGGLVGDVVRDDVEEQAGYETGFVLQNGEYAVIADVTEDWTNPIDTEISRLGGRSTVDRGVKLPRTRLVSHTRGTVICTHTNTDRPHLAESMYQSRRAPGLRRAPFVVMSLWVGSGHQSAFEWRSIAEIWFPF